MQRIIKENMVHCRLQAKISTLEASEFSLYISNIEVDEVHMSIKDVCAAINKLLERLVFALSFICENECTEFLLFVRM